MRIKKLGMGVCMAAGLLALIATAFPEAATDQGEGQAIVTILPQNNDKNTSIKIPQHDLQLKVNGKKSGITSWAPLQESNRNLELVILIDDSARDSLVHQFGEITLFMQRLPANVKLALGYMSFGRADLVGPLSTDHTQIASKLRIPKGVGAASSPYSCLSDLAKHWPSENRSAQREAVLITDGEGSINPENPYFKVAIADSVRAGLVVHSICWAGWGRGSGSTGVTLTGGLMLTATQMTGGSYCCEGNGEPVSLGPCLDGIAWRLQNQYRLSFHSALKGKPAIQRMDLKVDHPAGKVYAPQQVYVAPASNE